jgi:hypothetical protein
MYRLFACNTLAHVPADAHCQSLAQAVGAGGKSWRAYLEPLPVVESEQTFTVFMTLSASSKVL